MSDTLGAPAPAESTPAADASVSTPNPISTETEGQPEPDAKPEGKPEKPAADAPKPVTARQALEKAAAKVEKDAKEGEKPAGTKEVKTEAETKPGKDDKPARGDHGHFTAKDAKPDAPSPKPAAEAKPSYTAGDAPPRFTKDVKDVWATLPENVRGEVSRMERELTQGYEKHKQSAEAYEGYRELDAIAQQSGKKGHEVFREYYAMEQHLQRDLVGGLDAICQKVGVSLRDVAAHVVGQKPEQVSSQQDAVIRELKQELAGLKQQVGTVSQTFQHQQATTVGNEVAKFAADPAHSRFEELHEDIAFFLKNRCPGDLPKAYELAERLNPAPAKAVDAEAPKAPVIDLSVQTEKGSKSINGSPSPGSSPGKRQPSNSIKESLRKAMAAAG